MSSRTILVVPIYNEQDRLRLDRFAVFASADVELIFVDDGSTDATAVMLRAVADSPVIEVLSLSRNVGKGEAVRLGLRRALQRGADVVGYLDADLASPEDDVIRLVRMIHKRADLEVIMGARVGLLGRTITRRPARHFGGRVYATLAAAVLKCRVYDTQCGAKVFRASPALWQAVATPFGSRWAFDVELLGRLRVGTRTTPALPIESFREVPLETWVDVPGGKLTVLAALRATSDLLAVPHRLRGYRSTEIPMSDGERAG